MSITLNLPEAAQVVSGTPLGKDVVFTGVSTDSRTVTAGELFIALRGDKFDGHDFIATAHERGAVAAMVDTAGVASLHGTNTPLIVVENTRLALGALAANWRARFALPVIAVTGSNGKTTNKEMIASILREMFAPEAVLATKGNLNNDIGLPLTLLTLNASHRTAVVEMGMNHPGEIAYLAGIGRPTVALVTNAQRAHLAGMGSMENVAAEKGSLFSALNQSGIAIFCATDSWTSLWRNQSSHCRHLCFALGDSGEADVDVSGQCHTRGLDNILTLDYRGEKIEVTLALPGRHNARNALGAAAAALAAGVSLSAVRTGLQAFRGIKGRLQRRDAQNGATLLDDTYNANPDSVCAAIDVLAATVGKKIMVLGDMGEIGERTGQFHDEVGGYAKSQGIDQLLALGEFSEVAVRNFGSGACHFKKVEDLIDTLSKALTAETTVLIKGSRFMGMERVADAIALRSEGDPPC